MSDLQFEPDNLTGTRFGKVLQRLENQPRMTEISRVAGLSAREFFASFASESRPVILKGLIPTRLINTKETTRILEAAVGAEVVKARYGDYANPCNYIEHRLTKNLTLQAFLKNLQTEDKDQGVNYLANQELSSDAIKALNLHPPPYYSESDLRTPRMWLGPKHSITPLHKDGSDNFSLQIFGSKKWVLFPVRDYPFLYLKQPRPRSLPGFACSQLDIRKPDHERFPLYRYALPIEVEMAAGETLYLPAGWSHYVESLSTAMMINYWINNNRRLPACLEACHPDSPRGGLRGYS